MVTFSLSSPRDAAALVLQNAWRRKLRFHTTRMVLNRFLKIGFSMEKMASVP
jgi:hypothetical protein